jgi:hypothetical protein
LVEHLVWVQKVAGSNPVTLIGEGGRMRRSMSCETIKSVLRLQREYVSISLSYLDEMVDIAQKLEATDDPFLIGEYNRRLGELEVLVDENYGIACQIEELVK